jgi:hypothetical protein
MAEPIGGALIISKLRNCLNNDIFKFIACCKSWGVFKDEEEEIKKAEKRVRVQFQRRIIYFSFKLKNNLIVP